MKRFYLVIAVLLFVVGGARAQQSRTAPTPTPAPQEAARPSEPPRQANFDLSAAGVQIKPDARLIVVMAALDAAGFDPTPKGEEPSTFRALLHQDLASLNPDLRARLKSFYERHKLREEDKRLPPAQWKELPPAQQAARYVSLAYALGPAPTFEEPPRSLDLPGPLLEVLDFAPLVREFYRRSGIDERMPAYLRAYQAEGDQLRRSTVEMVRGVLSYLNTRPITTTIERITIKAPTTGKKKDIPPKIETREHERRFVIVPDLLAVPGAINFRVIADDYFVAVPYCDETKRYCAGRDPNPASPELRRAYVQYVIDPLVIRFNREIAARREQIKPLLDARIAAGAEAPPDIFLAVARSLTTAADVRLEETARLEALTREARSRLDKTADAAKRAELVRELETARQAVTDEATARLAEGYESGAVLDFFFAEQLRGVESSGFDIGNMLADMIASFDPVREAKRLEESDAARKRAVIARKAREAEGTADQSARVAELPNAALVNHLLEVDSLVRLKNYAAAEERLLALSSQYPNEPRVPFALAEIASRSASDATDEDVQSQRLNKALANYRRAVQVSTPSTDRCLVLRAHEAMGRILEFLEQRDEALREFDAAVQLNQPSCDAYGKAVEGKRRLSQQ